tara:strand:- start:4335 stop:5750 length:1416 start_codon:yes stop_codon:yes gene_type:complete
MDKSIKYNQITKRDIDFFTELVGIENLLTGLNCKNFGSDHTENLNYPPELVVFPQSTNDVSKILSYCNANLIPVTPSAALTGLSGGAIPVHGGISLSMKKMNKIISIDNKNFQATIEPGLINEDFQNKLKELNLFYPPDPASKGSCTLGGNFALNAGGPKAIKYGVTSNYVINLEIVLPSGNVFWTGANTLKNATGYNLTQLIIGSEGTLAIITQAVVRLLPIPVHKTLMLIPFFNNVHACDAVAKIMHDGIIPSSIEFMEKDAILFVKEKEYANIPFNIDNDDKSYLLIELDGANKDELFQEAIKINQITQDYDCGEVLFADTIEEQEKLWKVRRSIGLAVKAHSIYKEEDTVVPRANLSKLLSGVKAIGNKYSFKSICYGHAGDGNLHVNILKEGLDDHKWNHILDEAIREIFQLCVDLGGTISGEHGIGFVQKKYMDIPFCENNLKVQKEIKTIFDPNRILNPGKIFE